MQIDLHMLLRASSCHTKVGQKNRQQPPMMQTWLSCSLLNTVQQYVANFFTKHPVATMIIGTSTISLTLLWLYGIRMYKMLTHLTCKNNFPIFNTQGKKNCVALTIDDVPYIYESCILNMSTRMKQICTILQEYKCSATLMVIGSYLSEATPEMIELLQTNYAKGIVEFANHGQRNTKHYNCSAQEMEQEILKCEKEVSKYLRVDNMRFFRPGSGLYHQQMLNTAQQYGYKVVLGDVYSFDPHVILFFLNWLHIMITVRSGSVIILHDRPWTPMLLRWLLPVLKWRGYNVCKLSDCGV